MEQVVDEQRRAIILECRDMVARPVVLLDV
jgi:hypothetical protein